MHEELFIQRLYLGMEPEAQTSATRRTATACWPTHDARAAADSIQHKYQVVADGEASRRPERAFHIVNSGMTGSGLRVMASYSTAACWMPSCWISKRLAPGRALAHGSWICAARGGSLLSPCPNITVDADPDQAVWADGEIGRTPISVDVLPGALRVVVA
jgi:hypothetical protein